MPGGAPSSNGADGGSIYERGDVEGRRGWVCIFSLLLTAGAIEKIIAITCVSAESLAALSITGDATISTLPASSRQLGAALASAPASFLMARVGRRLGFIVGGSLGLGGSLVCALALVLRSFPLLCLGTTFVGVESGFAGYAKYVAAQVVPPRHKTRAISLSITSSVFAGVVAPRLVSATVRPAS
jgi:MFS family permease